METAKTAREMKQTALRIIKLAREMISSPDHWCQFKLAQDKLGNSCSPTSDSACQWCAIGALHKARYDLKLWDDFNFEDMPVTKMNTILGTTQDLLRRGLESQLSKTPIHTIQCQPNRDIASIVGANDTLNHNFILGVFDEAIEILTKELA